MKTIFLGFGLLFLAQRVFAVPCSQAIAGRPCAPDEGADTDKAKKEILGLIDRAQKAEPNVKDLKAKYLAIRNNSKVSAEEKRAIFHPFFLAQMEQNALYKQAMENTGKLHHVSPDRTHITIGQPSEPDLNYMSGLGAIWNPQVAEFDKEGNFAVKIEGSDREFHYSGAVKEKMQAATFEDGRVFVFKELFREVLRYKNPGLLALKLYHESRHFNQLSRPSLDGSAKTRSWASVEEDERDAYRACLDEAAAFGLDREDVDELIGQWAENDARVNNKLLTRRTADPAKEALRKKFYEEVQFNLMDEYFKLHNAVDAEKDKQRELQRVEREERERERAARERAATPAELVNELARCWYQPIYRSRSDDTIIAFKDDDARHSYYDERGTSSVHGLKILMLITRACDDIRRGVAPDKNKACNDAAPELRNPMPYDLVQKIENANSGLNAECAKDILANRARINDSRSFEKVVTDYQKADKKKRAEEAKQERKRKDGERAENPGGGFRPPDGIKRYWDPSCECWVREY